MVNFTDLTLLGSYRLKAGFSDFLPEKAKAWYYSSAYVGKPDMLILPVELKAYPFAVALMVAEALAAYKLVPEPLKAFNFHLILPERGQPELKVLGKKQ